MKRGLKAEPPPLKESAFTGCRVFPDEEGTERDARLVVGISQRRCRVFPDEEGTERLRHVAQRHPEGAVAEYSPMKRGLKELRKYFSRFRGGSCRVFPDEEGTESGVEVGEIMIRVQLQSIPR